MFPCSVCDGEGLIEEQETVRVHVLPMVGDGTVDEVPLRGLGVHNFYLRLHIRMPRFLLRMRKTSADQ